MILLRRRIGEEDRNLERKRQTRIRVAGPHSAVMQADGAMDNRLAAPVLTRGAVARIVDGGPIALLRVAALLAVVVAPG
jgi:hypothetical protein